MAVAVEGERDAAAPDDLLQQEEVAARVLDGAEEGVHGCAGRIVDGEQEGEARAALLEPGVVAAVDLEQHPLAGHPLTPDTVLGRPARRGLAMPARARIRRTVQLLTSRPSCSQSNSARWVWFAPG